MIECLPMEFSVCRVRDYSGVDLERPFTFTGRTDRERSLVCPTSDVPSDVMDREDGWRALRVSGTLDFALVGIISRIAGVLSGGIPVFVISTYDTDYILVRASAMDEAVAELSYDGHEITRL